MYEIELEMAREVLKESNSIVRVYKKLDSPYGSHSLREDEDRLWYLYNLVDVAVVGLDRLHLCMHRYLDDCSRDKYKFAYFTNAVNDSFDVIGKIRKITDKLHDNYEYLQNIIRESEKEDSDCA